MKNFNGLKQINQSSATMMKYLNFINVNDDLNDQIPGYAIYVNLGLTEDSNELPNLNLPMVTEDHNGLTKVFLDLRQYKKNSFSGTSIDEVTIKNTDKDTLILLSKTLLTFDESSKMLSIRIPYLKSLTFFIYSVLERGFLLNNIDKQYVIPAIASYIINMTDRTSKTETIHFLLKKNKLLLEDNEDIVEVIDKRNKFTSDTMGFVDYLKDIDISGKFTKLNDDIINTLLMATTIGSVNKTLTLMILEHPIPWLVLVDITTTNTLFKKTSLYSNLAHNKRATEVNKIPELMLKTL